MRTAAFALALVLVAGSASAGDRPEPPYLQRWSQQGTLDPPCIFYAVQDRHGWWSRMRLSGYPSPWVGPYRTKVWAVNRMINTVGRICEMPQE
jgi:hypothetical protein